MPILFLLRKRKNSDKEYAAERTSARRTFVVAVVSSSVLCASFDTDNNEKCLEGKYQLMGEFLAAGITTYTTYW